MTHLTFLWLGQVIGAAALSILQVATVGSAVLTNMIFDPSQGTPMIYVGAQQTMSPLASGLNFITNGTQTGAVVQANGVTQLQNFTFACTNTGGLTKYDTCISASPFTTTGAISQLSLSCSTPQVQFSASGSFAKARQTTPTASNFKNFGPHVLVGTGMTGGWAYYSTGMTLWNPVDFLRVGTITTASAAAGTALNNCSVRVSMFRIPLR